MNEQSGIESGEWQEVIQPRSHPVFTIVCFVFTLWSLPSLFVSLMTAQWVAVSLIIGTPICGLISGIYGQQRREPWEWLRRLAIGFCSVWLFVAGFFLLAMMMH